MSSGFNKHFFNMVKLPDKMRAVIQRVKSGSVKVEGREVARIGEGLLVFLAVEKGDDEKDADYMAEKIANLRIFDNEAGLPDKSALEFNREVLLVSQFTLYGNTRKGRRPSFDRAAPAEKAEKLFAKTVNLLRLKGVLTKTGRFGQKMLVEIENDGPFTLIVDSKKAG